MVDRLITQHLQDSIVRLCISDSEFLHKTRQALAPELLSASLPAKVLSICLAYYDQFHEAPGDHFHDEFVRHFEKAPEDEQDAAVTYITKLQGLPVNTEYVLSRLHAFVRARAMEQAVLETAEAIAQGDLEAAENLMYTALRTGIHTEHKGHEYMTDFSLAVRRGTSDEYLMTTGIPALDIIRGGFGRRQLVCIMGAPKGGKSWAGVNIGQTALLSGLRVLHISHEMTEDELEERYDMMIGGLTDNRPVPGKIWVPGSRLWRVAISEWDKEGHRSAVEVLRPSTHSLDAVRMVRQRIQKHGGSLMIKKYPMGTCTFSELERYINYLENFEGWIPDVVINDYADIMRPENQRQETRHQLSEIYTRHKQLADERNILVVTFSQCNRAAVRKARLSLKDFAEDIRKAAHIDLGLAICQTEEQLRIGEAVMFIIAARTGVMERGATIGMNLSIGQFCAWSKLGMVHREPEGSKSSDA